MNFHKSMLVFVALLFLLPGVLAAARYGSAPIVLTGHYSARHLGSLNYQVEIPLPDFINITDYKLCYVAAPAGFYEEGVLYQETAQVWRTGYIEYPDGKKTLRVILEAAGEKHDFVVNGFNYLIVAIPQGYDDVVCEYGRYDFSTGFHGMRTSIRASELDKYIDSHDVYWFAAPSGYRETGGPDYPSSGWGNNEIDFSLTRLEKLADNSLLVEWSAPDGEVPAINWLAIGVKKGLSEPPLTILPQMRYAGPVSSIPAHRFNQFPYIFSDMVLGVEGFDSDDGVFGDRDYYKVAMLPHAYWHINGMKNFCYTEFSQSESGTVQGVETMLLHLGFDAVYTQTDKRICDYLFLHKRPDGELGKGRLDCIIMDKDNQELNAGTLLNDLKYFLDVLDPEDDVVSVNVEISDSDNLTISGAFQADLDGRALNLKIINSKVKSGAINANDLVLEDSLLSGVTGDIRLWSLTLTGSSIYFKNPSVIAAQGPIRVTGVYPDYKSVNNVKSIIAGYLGLSLKDAEVNLASIADFVSGGSGQLVMENSLIRSTDPFEVKSQAGISITGGMKVDGIITSLVNPESIEAGIHETQKRKDILIKDTRIKNLQGSIYGQNANFEGSQVTGAPNFDLGNDLVLVNSGVSGSPTFNVKNSMTLTDSQISGVTSNIILSGLPVSLRMSNSRIHFQNPATIGTQGKIEVNRVYSGSNAIDGVGFITGGYLGIELNFTEVVLGPKQMLDYGINSGTGSLVMNHSLIRSNEPFPVLSPLDISITGGKNILGSINSLIKPSSLKAKRDILLKDTLIWRIQDGLEAGRDIIIDGGGTLYYGEPNVALYSDHLKSTSLKANKVTLKNGASIRAIDNVTANALEMTGGSRMLFFSNWYKERAPEEPNRITLQDYLKMDDSEIWLSTGGCESTTFRSPEGDKHFYCYGSQTGQRVEGERIITVTGLVKTGNYAMDIRNNSKIWDGGWYPTKASIINLDAERSLKIENSEISAASFIGETGQQLFVESCQIEPTNWSVGGRFFLTAGGASEEMFTLKTDAYGKPVIESKVYPTHPCTPYEYYAPLITEAVPTVLSITGTFTEKATGLPLTATFDAEITDLIIGESCPKITGKPISNGTIDYLLGSATGEECSLVPGTTHTMKFTIHIADKAYSIEETFIS